MISTTSLRRAAFRGLTGAAASLALVLPAQAQEWPAPNTAPASVMDEAPPPFPHWEGPVPTDWVDEETGHRIIRISGDEGGGKLYFYRNSFTPEGDLLVYSSPLGIMRYDLDEGRRSVLIDNPDADLMFTARTSRTVFYSISDPGEASIYDRPRTIYAADIDTGESRQMARIERGQVGSINADDTLLLGTVAGFLVHPVGRHGPFPVGKRRRRLVHHGGRRGIGRGPFLGLSRKDQRQTGRGAQKPPEGGAAQGRRRDHGVILRGVFLDIRQGAGSTPSTRTVQPSSGKPGAWPSDPSQPAAIMPTAHSSEPLDGK